jgi:hypothetical protein
MHLFNVRKASLSSRVPSFCGIDNGGAACQTTYRLIPDTSPNRELVYLVFSVGISIVLIN